jgi:hypothetical protein
MLVVSHARIIRAVLSKGYIEGKKPGLGFANPKFCKNCEIVPVIASENDFVYEH